MVKLIALASFNDGKNTEREGDKFDRDLPEAESLIKDGLAKRVEKSKQVDAPKAPAAKVDVQPDPPAKTEVPVEPVTAPVETQPAPPVETAPMLADLTKKELEVYTLETFGVDLDLRKSKTDLLVSIENFNAMSDAQLAEYKADKG